MVAICIQAIVLVWPQAEMWLNCLLFGAALFYLAAGALLWFSRDVRVFFEEPKPSPA
jgi:hypothetical protein